MNPGIVLDAGALIGLERGNRRVVDLIRFGTQKQFRIVIPCGVIAQVYRSGRRQARLSRLLKSPLIEKQPLDLQRSRQIGQLLGVSNTTDVVDASVVLAARNAGPQGASLAVVTSDPDDITRLDPTIPLIVI